MFFRIAYLTFGTAMFITTMVQADESASIKAKKRFEQGKNLYYQGHFAKAATEFQAALNLEKRTSTIINLAQCYRQLNQPRKALFYYRLYLTEWQRQNPNQQPPAFHAEVKAHIRLLEEKIHQNNRLEPQSDTHKPQMDKRAKENTAKTPDDPPGEKNESGVPKADISSVHAVSIKSPRSNGLGIPFWIALSATVVSGTVTTIFGIRAVEAHSDFINSGRQDRELKEKGERDKLITNVALGITGAAALTTAILGAYRLWFTDKTSKLAVTPMTIDAQGLRVSLHF